MDGPPVARLATRENRLKLLNFLISECQAAMMNNLENQLQKCSMITVRFYFLKSSLFSDVTHSYFSNLGNPYS
jgi:hypothetical protein